METLSQEDEKTIVLITHKLKEIKDFTETIYVMKNGKMVAKDLDTKTVSDTQLIELMMGEVKTSKFDKNNFKPVTDLMTRVKIRDKVIDEISLYNVYDVKNGETPENIAFKHFGDPRLHWVILLTNKISDRYYDWPLSEQQFEDYIKDKYAEPGGIHHYEITQSSGRTTGQGPSDYSYKVEVNSTVAGATSISNREYESRLQDKKRQIKLLSTQYLTSFVEEFNKLIRE